MQNKKIYSKKRTQIVPGTMKSVVFAFFYFTCMVSAFAGEVYSQQVTKLSLAMEKSTIRDVISQIERQSDYVFLYTDDGSAELNKTVSISVKDKDLPEVLGTLFANTNLSYKITGKQVVVTKKSDAEPVKTPAEKQTVQQSTPRVITGTVSDKSGTLPGASILLKGSSEGTMADADGKFAIKVPDNATLVFSFLGYTTQEIKVGNNSVINVTMAETTQAIDEVVVVGYGTQKKATLIGSVSQVKGEEIVKTGTVGSVSQAIQGMMPGVVSVATDSKPGRESADILIRGMGTWHSTTPLYLVDGVERDFNEIDANEIESISVLKDAAATAVYGVRGGNGVIIVTTKRGLNQHPVINFSANFGAKQATHKPQFSDYVTAMNMWSEACANDGDWGDVVPQSTISAWKKALATGNTGPYNDYFPSIDWWNEMIKPLGFDQQYNLNIRGGTDFAKYFVSFGYLNEGDIYHTVSTTDLYKTEFNYKRYNWRTNLDFNLTKSTTFTVNLSGSLGTRNQPGYRVGNANAQIDNEDAVQNQQFFQDLYTGASHVFPIKWSDGTYGVAGDGNGNIYVNFDDGQRIYKYYNNFIDTNLKQQLDFITKGLSAQARLSYTTSSSTQSRIQRYKGTEFGPGNGQPVIRYSRKYDYSQPLPDGGYAMTSQRWPDAIFQGDSQGVAYDLMTQGGYTRRLNYGVNLNYDRTFGPHAITVMGVFDRYENEALKDNDTSSMKIQECEEAWVTRATYNYAERYLLEFSGAYTGSPRFARGQRFHFFPAYSVGWRLSEEPFVKKSPFANTFSNIKLRYSYGTVGYDANTTSFFTYIQTYQVGTGGLNLGSGTGSSQNYGPFYTEGQIPNANATWETSYKQNLGLDLGLIHDNLTATIDLYQEHREGILMTRTTPAWFGLKDPDANLGRTKTHGLEVELGWKSKIGKDFRYWLKANVAFSENRVLDHNDPLFAPDYQKLAGKPINGQTRLIVTGYYGSLDDIFNYASVPGSQGALVPGDFMYADYNADGVIVNSPAGDQIQMKNQSYACDTYGWSLGFSWNHFDFSMMWYGVFGISRNVASQMLWDLSKGSGGNYYAFTDVLNRWTPETAAYATKPALHTTYSNGNVYNQWGSTYTYQDQSYLRLKNTELAYSIDKRLIRKLGLSQCQFYINGTNLLTFTGFNKNLDPEANSTSLYPTLRHYNLGVRVGF